MTEQEKLQLHQKLDAILGALGFEVEQCCHCEDGIRECGLRSDPVRVRCYHCEGSTILIKKVDGA